MNVPSTEGPVKPGDNPNARNAQPRKSARPKTQNSSNGDSNKGMRLGWIDPLPKVDAIMPIGLDPSPESFPSGDFELNFDLPGQIVSPFSSLVSSVGDRIQMDDDAVSQTSTALKALSYFKAARQLYSTMLDSEKAINQPLKAIYYDETPIPVHMGAAIGIIGHMDTKVGKILVKHASTLFKRWIAQGVKIGTKRRLSNDFPERLVWEDRDGLSLVHELARAKIDELTRLTYEVNVTVGEQQRTLTVSMPRLTDQDLVDYYNQINPSVPEGSQLKDCVSLLQMDQDDWSNRHIPNGRTLNTALSRVQLVRAEGVNSVSRLRQSFEDWSIDYVTGTKWRVESIFSTGPSPAGSNGFGAQLVDADKNVARWGMPLSDTDVSMGYLFSPNKSFSLYPRMIAYGRRQRQDASAEYAYRDGKAFVKG